jgi:hypothetical protein
VLEFESPAEIKFLKAALTLAFWLLAIIILAFASYVFLGKAVINSPAAHVAVN